MAATDLLRVCTFSLKAATFITKDWIFGSVVCKLSIYLESMCAANTIHCLMYISLERYMYICKPPDKKLTARKVLLIIGITWAYTLAAPVLMVFLWAVTEVEFEGQVYSFCGEEPSMKMFGFRLRLIYIALFYYIVPILFTCLNYFRIYRTVRQSTNRVNNKLGSSSRNGKAQLRLVTMFIVSITFFVLMWVPLYIHEIIRTLTEMSDNTYFIIISLIALTNTFQNPIIYGYYNKFFNDEFRKMCCCKSIPLRKGATISTMQSHVSHTDVSKALWIRKLWLKLHLHFCLVLTNNLHIFIFCKSVNSSNNTYGSYSEYTLSL